MKNFVVAGLCASCVMGNAAHAASAVNLDAEPRTLIVPTAGKGGSKSELSLAAGETSRVLLGRLLRHHAQRGPPGADRHRDGRDFGRRRPSLGQALRRASRGMSGRAVARPFNISGCSRLTLICKAVKLHRAGRAPH